MEENVLLLLLREEQFNDMFKVISGIMANWYELITTFLFTINLFKVISNLMVQS